MRFHHVPGLPGGSTRQLRCAVSIAAVVVVMMAHALGQPGTVHPAVATRRPPQTFDVGRRERIHFMLTAPETQAASKAQAAAAPAASCGSHCNLMTYGGGAVMHNSTIYAIYWLPRGYSYGANSDASYEKLINQFFGDLSGTAYYNILTQYPDYNGPLLDNTSFGGSYVDTTPYPCGTTCGDTGTPGRFLTDSDIQNEVLNAARANHWSPGLGNMYMVFTGSGVQSCVNTARKSCSSKSLDRKKDYCAYHSAFSSSNGAWLYSNMYDAGADQNCQGGVQSPNGDPVADAEISVTSHEVFETITDPEPNGRSGWAASGRNQYGQTDEIGDLCAYKFNGNTTLNNGHQYSLQEEWSNFDGDCVHGDSISTSLQYAGPTRASRGDKVTLSATVLDRNGNGVGEQTIKFSMGSQSCSGTTDFFIPGTSLGHASCQIALNQYPGSYTVTTSYLGGSGAYQASSTSAPFSIDQKARPR